METRKIPSHLMKEDTRTRTMPAVFVSHGSPMVALESGPYGEALEEFGKSVVPEAILVISAHWEESEGIRVSAGERPKLIYDFGGFPRELYELRYDAPGSPALATEVRAALAKIGLKAILDSDRGWDHGLWVPLRLMFPRAKVPVVELSLPMNASPEDLSRTGEALPEFRRRGVLILGSGGIVHNLRFFRGGPRDAPVDSWAREFENWVREAIQRHDLESLFAYASKAPHAALAVPTPEHFAPLFVIMGAASPYSQVVSIFNGFEYGNISMHCFALE